jgi:two-component system chemotaxis response regulator CheY
MRALIIDDSKAMRMIIKRTLRQAGFLEWDIEEAADGRLGLRKILSLMPDLVLSDWNMPGMTGMELLEEIRVRGLDVCIGFVTAEGTPMMRKRAEKAGARFYIPKPFTVQTFRKALSPVLFSLIDRERRPS